MPENIWDAMKSSFVTTKGWEVGDEARARQWKECSGDDKAEWPINGGKVHAMEMTRLAKQNWESGKDFATDSYWLDRARLLGNIQVYNYEDEQAVASICEAQMTRMWGGYPWNFNGVNYFPSTTIRNLIISTTLTPITDECVRPGRREPEGGQRVQASSQMQSKQRHYFGLPLRIEKEKHETAEHAFKRPSQPNVHKFDVCIYFAD